jgi:hypothetical protein
MRHAGPPIVLDAQEHGYRAGRGRQVAFVDGPGESEQSVFSDDGVPVAQASLVPAEGDVAPFAEHIASFLYAGTSPDLSAYAPAPRKRS